MAPLLFQDVGRVAGDRAALMCASVERGRACATCRLVAASACPVTSGGAVRACVRLERSVRTACRRASVTSATRAATPSPENATATRVSTDLCTIGFVYECASSLNGFKFFFAFCSCTKRCPEALAGRLCPDDCRCQNGGSCDAEDGSCQCTPGFTVLLFF